MKKYDALGKFLEKQWLEEVPMTFAKIEQVIGGKLPKSQCYPAWWSNSTTNNVMTQVWLDAGYRTERVDIEGRKLVFKRVAGSAKGRSGMSDTAREFTHSPGGANKSGSHPLIGSMKGTFTIEGWDLTKPSLDPDELAEWDASLDRKAELYEQGLKRKS